MTLTTGAAFMHRDLDVQPVRDRLAVAQEVTGPAAMLALVRIADPVADYWLEVEVDPGAYQPIRPSASQQRLLDEVS
jgi:hypothetical protein